MSHSKESVLNAKEPVKYTNKLIEKTTGTKLQRILAVNKKIQILSISVLSIFIFFPLFSFLITCSQLS